MRDGEQVSTQFPKSETWVIINFLLSLIKKIMKLCQFNLLNSSLLPLSLSLQLSWSMVKSQTGIMLNNSDQGDHDWFWMPFASWVESGDLVILIQCDVKKGTTLCFSRKWEGLAIGYEIAMRKEMSVEPWWWHIRHVTAERKLRVYLEKPSWDQILKIVEHKQFIEVCNHTRGD